MTLNIIAVLMPVALAIIMFGLGLSLTIDDFKRIFQHPKSILIGASTQLIVLPILGFLVAKGMLSDQPELAVGLIILAMCPGGPTSNLLTHLGNGDTALCISLTAISSIVKTFTIPVMVNLAIELYLGESNSLQLEIFPSIAKIFAITLVPASIGMFVRTRSAAFAQSAEKPVKLLSALFLVLIIVGAILKEKDSIGTYFAAAGLSALVLNLSGMAVGYLLPQLFNLSAKQRFTISIETSIQNGTLAITIATLMLHNNTMAIPAAVYSIIMFITAGIFISLLKKQETKA
ncbi:MAG: bile acid:sodium symporter family protein [Cytophagaceae bacterium]|jgi:BASS family bile acid:Na+ symporter|nr:bile acid:sodium symporter family protein [Cytophagaceae bacterium]